MGAAAVTSGSAYVRLFSLAILSALPYELVVHVLIHAQPVLDGILGVSLIVHSHIGFDSVVVDYLHTRKFPILGPIAAWGLRVATGLAVWGVYEFNTNDIGAYLLNHSIFFPQVERRD